MTILNKILENPRKSAFFSGLLLVFALPPCYQVWLTVIAFGCLIILLQNASDYKKAFFVGYWFGFGFFSFGLSWIANALVLDLIHFGWLIPIAVLASGAFFGVFVGIPAMLTHFFKNDTAKILAFSAFWGIFEWLRSFFLTGFPWNLLGSIWTFDHRFLQLAACFGTYGLSSLTVFMAILPFNRQKKLFSLLISVLLLVCMAGFGFWRCYKIDNVGESDLRIRVVQPSIPQNLKWNYGDLENNFADYVEMSQDKDFENFNAVIWGETASTFALKWDKTHFMQIMPAIPDDGYLITGSIDYLEDEEDRFLPVNAGLVLNHAQGVISDYAKTHLVPFGEYLPLRRFLPAGLRPITNVIADFKSGEGNKTVKTESLPPFGILICYEIIFPHEIINSNDRPQWLINLTNDGWYGRSFGPYQHLAAAQLRAAEEGITIVRAANSGVSALISRSGKILASIGLQVRGNLDFYLPENRDIITPYARYGNLCFFVLAALLLATALIADYKPRMKKINRI
ncbi:MAG: apolipoprotein N-acyltransferase [Alphaproteobacteria bacterium]|nr:apolipoprotein N-acyltransferase [Alphaproteobacteria bacterium]